MIVVWLLVGLVGLVLLVAAVGHALPSGVTGEAHAVIAAPPADVWNAMHGDEPLAVSQGAKSLARLPDAKGMPSWVEDIGSSKITVITTEAERERRVARSMTDAVVPVRAECDVTLEPVEGGTRTSCRYGIDVATGSWHVPLLRIMLRVGGGGRRPARDYLRRLGARLGQSPRFE